MLHCLNSPELRHCTTVAKGHCSSREWHSDDQAQADPHRDPGRRQGGGKAACTDSQLSKRASLPADLSVPSVRSLTASGSSSRRPQLRQPPWPA